MIRKLENYTPTKFMLPTSHYDKKLADNAVNFIEKFCKHTKGEWDNQPFELIDWQEKIIRDLFGVVKENGYRQFTKAYIEIPKKNGKELDINTLIPTPDGFTKMGDLKVGDVVFDEEGKQCHVVAKSPIDTKEQPYKITFRDGSYIIAGENHLWDVDYIYGKPKHKIMKTSEIYNKAEKVKAHYLKKNNIIESNRSIIRIKTCKPLNCKDRILPVDPYLYGYWIGNGTSTCARITVHCDDVTSIIKNIPYKPDHVANNIGNSKHIYYKELKKILIKNATDKSIDPIYLRASKEQRWSLLQGLMDSDGCISNEKGQSIYISSNIKIANAVRELLSTLGIKNTINKTNSMFHGRLTGEIIYRVLFTTFDDMPTSKLKRKNIRSSKRIHETRSSFHYIKSIKPINYEVKMQCIQVDSSSHCYLAGTSFIPTHNSELAAAVALKLLCADNEPGAEIYGCATDRAQADIVFKVAADMVRKNPTLSEKVKIRESKHRLIYTKTRSFYQVLSAEAYSKDGLNVHGVIFDELHAQPDRKLFDVMTVGSGDARRQPLYFFITTAGNNINSICYEQHQKAADIIKGRKSDPTFYPVLYGLDMEEDWTNEDNWKKANPSIGMTVGIEKVREAFNTAKSSAVDENVFRQLRLNQWVKQSVRWMKMSNWDKCKVTFDEEMLKGRDCYGGLDLSTTIDITAFVLVFPPLDEEDNYWVLPFFWCPEGTIEIRSTRDHVLYNEWAGEHFIKATEGNVVHYDHIEQEIIKLGEKFHILEIAFDRWNATQMSQHLTDAGFEMVQFGQGFKDMTPACREFERLVIANRLAHNGHPVLRWMVDNIVVKTDAAGNIKFDKEKSSEKIDGAVALVMALSRAMVQTNTESVYNNRGLTVI